MPADAACHASMRQAWKTHRLGVQREGLLQLSKGGKEMRVIYRIIDSGFFGKNIRAFFFFHWHGYQSFVYWQTHDRETGKVPK